MTWTSLENKESQLRSGKYHAHKYSTCTLVKKQDIQIIAHIFFPNLTEDEHVPDFAAFSVGGEFLFNLLWREERWEKTDSREVEREAARESYEITAQLFYSKQTAGVNIRHTKKKKKKKRVWPINTYLVYHRRWHVHDPAGRIQGKHEQQQKNYQLVNITSRFYLNIT